MHGSVFANGKAKTLPKVVLDREQEYDLSVDKVGTSISYAADYSPNQSKVDAVRQFMESISSDMDMVDSCHTQYDINGPMDFSSPYRTAMATRGLSQQRDRLIDNGDDETRSFEDQLAGPMSHTSMGRFEVQSQRSMKQPAKIISRPLAPIPNRIIEQKSPIPKRSTTTTTTTTTINPDGTESIITTTVTIDADGRKTTTTTEEKTYL